MELNDFFELPDESQNGLMHQFQQEIFPDGKLQIEREINRVRVKLDFKYSKEEIKDAYFNGLVLYYKEKDKGIDNISDIILQNQRNALTKEDAIQLFHIIQEKFNSIQLQNYIRSVNATFNEGHNLFLIAKTGIVELAKAYKVLSDKGKFEVIIFNAITVLSKFRESHPDEYEQAEEDFFIELVNQAKTYQIDTDPDKLMSFVNSRFRFYSQEIASIYEGEGYIPGKLYNAFYISPLTKNPEPNSDLGEIMLFFFGLTTMMRWVSDNAKTI